MNERLGIAGSGAIASGLAAVGATRGEVLLWARSPASAARASAAVEKACGKIDADPERVRIVGEIGDLRAASFLVEAVAEDLAIKAEVLGRLSDLAAGDALLASTTSSLSVAALAAATGAAERFVGLHVFNPVPAMELVELVFPEAAADETRRRARELCAALGKVPVEAPDTPGFVVNRLLFPYLFGAVRLLEESGLAPEDVDTCMQLGAGHPMGPLALLDYVGLDVAAAIGASLGEAVPSALRERVAAGHLGRKAGRGFYVSP